MSWAIGFDTKWNRDIGYGVPAFCDYPGCTDEIDRGLSYVCGGEPYGGDRGCGLYFCGNHIKVHERLPQLCAHCSPRRLAPFTPSKEHPKWAQWKLTHSSWEQWRSDSPEEVKALEQIINDSIGRYGINPLIKNKKLQPGERYNRMVLMEPRGLNKNGSHIWLCRCDCGTDKVVVGSDVRRGKIQSCGCKNYDRAVNRDAAAKFPFLYGRWMDLRGHADAAWQDFDQFRIDVADKYFEGATIRRIDRTKPSSKENCRWVGFIIKQRGKRMVRSRKEVKIA